MNYDDLATYGRCNFENPHRARPQSGAEARARACRVQTPEINHNYFTLPTPYSVHTVYKSILYVHAVPCRAGFAVRPSPSCFDATCRAVCVWVASGVRTQSQTNKRTPKFNFIDNHE